jgi:hypothetical protein
MLGVDRHYDRFPPAQITPLHLVLLGLFGVFAFAPTPAWATFVNLGPAGLLMDF